MELLFALGIIGLTVAGLALGLMLTGKPPRTACAGVDRLPESRCADCPLRKAEGEDHA